MLTSPNLFKAVATLLAIASLEFACLAATTDWPQWHGKNRDNISTEKGLLQDWPAGGPPLAWKASGLGAGHSTVSVAGNRIITLGDKGDASYVIALARNDGKPLWTAKVGKAGAPGWGGFAGPRSTPTVDADLVFALGQYGELVCVDVTNGKEVWRKQFDSDFGAKSPEWGFSEAPLVDANNVVITPGGSRGTIVALNKKTGALVWSSKDFTDMAAYASIVKADLGGVPQYVQLTEASLVGIAPGDGKFLWRAPRRGAMAVIPTPIVSGDQVYVTSGYGIGCNLFQITKAGSESKAEELYANKVMVNHHDGVVKIGEHIYGYSDGKGWTCQELKTGRMV